MKNLCHNAFIGLHIDVAGRIRPCCKYLGSHGPYFDIKDGIEKYQKSEWLLDLQKQFIDGKKPAGCMRCWKEEDAGIKSKRQLDYERFQDDFDKVDLKRTEFKNIELNFGNLCNLACRICSPKYSSKWASELSNLDGKKYVIYDWYKDKKIMEEIYQNTKNAIGIDIIGGEPMLVEIKEHFDYLNRLKEDNYAEDISLHYTTNGTIFPKEEYLNTWSSFKEIDIQLSIDGIEEQFEFNRWPAKWSQVYSNIKRYQKLAKESKNIKLSLSHTISAFTIYYADDFVKWCLREGLPMPWMGPLNFPTYYRPSVFKKSVRDKIKEHLLQSKSSRVRNLISYLDTDDSDGFGDFEDWVTKLDKARNQTFSETFPELWDLVK